MRKILMGLYAFTLVLSIGTLGWAAAVTGDLTKIDEKGSFYFIKDSNGKEHKVHFDATTKKSGDIQVGSRVMVDEEKGHAKNIQVMAGGSTQSPSLQPLPSGSQPSSQPPAPASSVPSSP